MKSVLRFVLKWGLALCLIIVGGGFVAGIAVLLHGIGASVPSAQAQNEGSSTGSTKNYHLTIQTFPATPTAAWMAEHHYQLDSSQIPPLDFHADWVRYGPTTNFVIPAHALVTITIQNYDGQSPILNSFYSQVQGTVDGSMLVNGKPAFGLDPSTVSHTFTIHSIPSSEQPWLYVSVPLLGEPDAVEDAGTDNGFPPQPEVMQFTIQTGAPGTYIWQCFDPCGWGFDGFGGPMQTRGYMSGTITVQG